MCVVTREVGGGGEILQRTYSGYLILTRYNIPCMITDCIAAQCLTAVPDMHCHWCCFPVRLDDTACRLGSILIQAIGV